MAPTLTHSEITVQQWESKYFAEYVRRNQFAEFMGTGMNNVLQVKERLMGLPGDSVTIPLVRALSGAGVTGSSTLEGSEEALKQYGHQITIDALRNGVSITGWEMQKSAIDLLNGARDMLMNWSMDQLRNDVLAALQSPNINGKTTYAATTEDDRDIWLTQNSDRVLFGEAVGNTHAGFDHSLSLDAITTATGRMDTGIVTLAKRLAKSASEGAIRPFRVNGSEEWFVLFCNSLCFRDLKEDSVMRQANREAGVRGRENTIFKDSDLIYDGVIVREVPEIPVITGVGDSTSDVAPNFLCGAQAVGVAYAQRPKAKMQTDDYGFRQGVAIEEMRGVEKLTYKNAAATKTVQHGVLTVYASAPADA